MTALEINGVSKSLSHRTILDDIAFTMQSGQIVGLVGPNGAGKTTLMRLISGLIYPNSGEIKIMSHDLKSERETALACLSAVVEGPSLYPQLTGLQHLKMIASLRGLPSTAIEEAAEFTGLGKQLNDRVPKYSMGMKQRLALGISLMTKPDLLLLDEPTNGLDPTGTIELRKELKHIAASGTAILISSHILSELQRTVDLLIFLHAGKIGQPINNDGSQDVEMLYISEFGGGHE